MIHSGIPSFSSIGKAGRAIAASRLSRIRALLDLRTQHALRNESGSSLVEFALSAVVLFMLIFGVIAICMALYTYNVVAETAREATRYAIVRGSHCSPGTFSNCNIDQTGLQTYVQSLGFPGINPSSLKVTASATTPITLITCTSTLTPCNNPGSTVQVTVQYKFPLVIPFVPSRQLTMSSTSAMVISQ